MAKLKIWIASQSEDSSCYNLISKTKKDLLIQIKKHDHIKYNTIGLYEIFYNNAFDLFDYVTSESGGRNPNIYKKINEKTID